MPHTSVPFLNHALPPSVQMLLVKWLHPGIRGGTPYDSLSQWQFHRIGHSHQSKNAHMFQARPTGAKETQFWDSGLWSQGINLSIFLNWVVWSCDLEDSRNHARIMRMELIKRIHWDIYLCDTIRILSAYGNQYIAFLKLFWVLFSVIGNWKSLKGCRKLLERNQPLMLL